LTMRRWDPFKDLLSLQERMENLFGPPEKEESLSPGIWSPVLDLYETSDSLIINVEVPGIDIQDIHIEINDNTLLLKGERKFEKEVTQENYHRMERPYGPFQRTFTLPGIIEHEKAKAKLKDGVLKVTFPKTGIKKAKKIEVEIN